MLDKAQSSALSNNQYNCKGDWGYSQRNDWYVDERLEEVGGDRERQEQ